MSTNPDKIICLLNCINQYTKNKPLSIKNKGSMSVSTDKNGNQFGAKNGKK